jgi:hypothetical protein
MVRNLQRIFCVHCFLMVIGLTIYAQGNESVTEQLWVDVIPHFAINERLEYYGDASLRIVFEENTAYTMVVRPSVFYRLNPTVELRGGLGFFYTIIENNINQLEIRPWQGVRIHWPTLGPIGIKHYLKLEERLLWETEVWDFDPAFRFRYKLGGRIPFNESRKFYLSLFGEAFVNFGLDDVALLRDRMRGYIGLGHQINDTWTMELEFMLQRSRSNEIEDFDVSGHIFRLKLVKDGWVW